ncbi:hypothetical protein L7F22_010139, partial [Adiantum nelumboides]|nr:hypothetical protein [Adiantum nelumboides]
VAFFVGEEQVQRQGKERGREEEDGQVGGRTTVRKRVNCDRLKRKRRKNKDVSSEQEKKDVEDWDREYDHHYKQHDEQMDKDQEKPPKTTEQPKPVETKADEVIEGSGGPIIIEVGTSRTAEEVEVEFKER